MIIDAQSHYMPPEVAQNTTFYKVGWSDVDRQLSLMDQSRIAKAVLLYPTSDAHLKMGGWQTLCRIYNDGIADTVKRFPGRFIGGGILPVDSPELIPAELQRLRDLNLQVISLASSYDARYLDDEIFFPVYEFAQKHHMPVHVHSQIMSPIGEDRVRDPLLTPVLEYVMDVTVCIGKLLMSGVFQRFPDVNFIFAHYGGVLPIVKERFDTTYAMLRRREYVKDLKQSPSQYFKNLYFDTSGSRSPASLLCALEVVDPSHILFASDYPANPNLSDAMSVIQNSPLAADAKAGILGNNFQQLLA